MLATLGRPVQVGAMSCFDREFPESARVLAFPDAELVLIRSACHFDDHRLAQLNTRAFEDKLALAMTSYPNIHPDGGGWSVAVSPVAWEFDPGKPRPKSRGTLLLEAGAAPGIHYCEFDLDAIRDYRRNSICSATFRHPEIYAALVDPKLVPEIVENEKLIH